MKKTTTILTAIVAFATLCIFSSCEKDEGKLPAIEFITGGSYISESDTFAQGQTIMVGIHAEKTEGEDVLKKLNESVSYDNGSLTTVDDYTIPSASEDMLDKDYSITTRNQAGTERFVFTVTNRDGLTNQVELTLTVL